MPAFNRCLPQAALDRLDDNLAAHGWFADLLRRWRPAGNMLDGLHRVRGLRIAIRDGYLNFYRNGQSVAKVTFDAAGTPQADIHNKYVREGGLDQAYVRLKHDRFADPAAPGTMVDYTPERLDDWIVRADGYSGPEKRFVEALVARNGNVVDLEMGLPALDAPGAPRTAPRMDLVAVEFDPVTCTYNVVFWEAKGVRDGRLRRQEGAPEVVAQLEAYRQWLSQPGHALRIAEAYRDTCRLLVRLHDAQKRLGAPATTLGQGGSGIGDMVDRVAVGGLDGETPAQWKVYTDRAPRLVVDNLTEADRSFAGRGHLAKLEDEHAILVQVVNSECDLALPDRELMFETRGARRLGRKLAGQAPAGHGVPAA